MSWSAQAAKPSHLQLAWVQGRGWLPLRAFDFSGSQGKTVRKVPKCLAGNGDSLPEATSEGKARPLASPSLTTCRLTVATSGTTAPSGALSPVLRVLCTSLPLLHKGDRAVSRDRRQKAPGRVKEVNKIFENQPGHLPHPYTSQLLADCCTLASHRAFAQAVPAACPTGLSPKHAFTNSTNLHTLDVPGIVSGSGTKQGLKQRESCFTELALFLDFPFVLQ